MDYLPSFHCAKKKLYINRLEVVYLLEWEIFLPKRSLETSKILESCKMLFEIFKFLDIF